MSANGSTRPIKALKMTMTKDSLHSRSTGRQSKGMDWNATTGGLGALDGWG